MRCGRPKFTKGNRMATEFATARFPEGEMPKIQTRAEMLDRVDRFIPDGGKARIREAGGEWGAWRGRADAISRIRDRVSKVGVGPKLIVQREHDREMLSIREIAFQPD